MRWVAVLAVCGAVACGGKEATSPDGGLKPDGGEPQAVTPGLDEFYAELSQHGGFGGFFLDDDGIPNAWMKDLREEAKADLRTALTPFLTSLREAGSAQATPENLRLLQGQYTWVELQTWMAALGPLFEIPDVGMLDADELKNRVSVGVHTEEARAAVEAYLAAQTLVPRDAVSLSVVSRPKQLWTLHDGLNPPVGGTGIRWKTAEAAGTCTLGFHARSDVWGQGFITASHCTAQMADGRKDGRVFTFFNGNPAGSEVFDPAFRPGIMGCPASAWCRHGDMSFIQYNPYLAFSAYLNYRAQNPFMYGYLVRTLRTCHAEHVCSMDVDSPNWTHPLRQLNPGQWRPTTSKGHRTELPVGVWVNKTGVTTGHTVGPITRACFVVRYGNTERQTFACQYHAAMGANEGDSGGPVYLLQPDGQAEPIGILSGGTPPWGMTFSLLGLAEREMAPFETMLRPGEVW